MLGFGSFSDFPFSDLAEGGILVDVTGVSATTVVGNVTVSADANVSVIGFNANSVATGILQAASNNEPGKTLFKDTTIAGRSLGDINNDGNVSSSDALAYLQWGQNRLTGAGKTYIETVLNPYMVSFPVEYSAYITSVYGAIGNANTAVNITAITTGVSALGVVGAVAVETSANVLLTGVSAALTLGSVVVTGDAVLTTTGVTATGQIGSAVVTADANVPLTGVEATGQTGTVTVLVVVPVTGVQGTTALGTITLESNNYLDVTGFGLVGTIGDVSVVGVWSIPDADANVWTDEVPGANVWTEQTYLSNTWTAQ